MKVWLVQCCGTDSEVVAVCASEELALEAANEWIANLDLEVVWETLMVVTFESNEVIYGHLTDCGDAVTDNMLIECREVKDD